MRSAVYYPETRISSLATMRAALLMWDEVHVIVPWEEFRPTYDEAALAEAWELVGSTMRPDPVQQRRAHDGISDLLASGLTLDVHHPTDGPAPKPYEMWSEKLLPQTWELLREHGLSRPKHGDGGYTFEEQGGLAVMSKLADACAGTTFARWTDRFSAYGLVADRAGETAAQTAIVPLTLSLVDPAAIPIERLIEFRRRERVEKNGRDYRAMRHRYADAVAAHVEATKAVESPNELKELRRVFREGMRNDLKDLSDALRVNVVDAIAAPVVVTTAVAATSWLATGSRLVTAVAAAGNMAVKAAELFRLRSGFDARQRKIMTEHPMAYLYQLGRMR